MADRNYRDEDAEHRRRQMSANRKIAEHASQLMDARTDRGRKTCEQQVMNEMRGNKSTVDFNRALFDYDAEHGRVRVPRSKRI